MMRRFLDDIVPAPAETHLTTDPYLGAGTYDTYYGGLKTMMPWTGVYHR